MLLDIFKKNQSFVFFRAVSSLYPPSCPTVIQWATSTRSWRPTTSRTKAMDLGTYIWLWRPNRDQWLPSITTSIVSGKRKVINIWTRTSQFQQKLTNRMGRIHSFLNPLYKCLKTFFQDHWRRFQFRWVVFHLEGFVSSLCDLAPADDSIHCGDWCCLQRCGHHLCFPNRNVYSLCNST